MSNTEEFVRLTDPFRRELMAHCYRMLGSVDDAEDLVQETYLRAWRSYNGFEGRSSLRTWLYRIATTACLTALERRSRRPLPSGLGAPSDDPEGPLAPERFDVPWLQPMPDSLLATAPADPATIVAARAGLRLALVAALQHLPAKQRAVLILRDVVTWRAVEVAEVLGTTTAAVNSALQRARAQIEQVAAVEDEVVEPAEPARRALIDRYVAAFEEADITALLQVLRDDAVLEMPPFVTWFTGRDNAARFLGPRVFGRPGDIRMIPTAANGQPAVAAYRRGHDGLHHPYGVHVLTVTASGIARIVVFLDPSLVARFGLAPTCGDAPGLASATASH